MNFHALPGQPEEYKAAVANMKNGLVVMLHFRPFNIHKKTPLSGALGILQVISLMTFLIKKIL